MLILGIGIFVASFVLPEKKEKLKESDRRFGEAEIKEMVNAQLADVKDKVSDAADETISDIMEKTERSLERITNEKIMAVNEYSDTVLDAIHKNHEEVMFLYDMLNDKHDKLKNTAAEVEKKAKETLKKVKEAENTPQPAPKPLAPTQPEPKINQKKAVNNTEELKPPVSKVPVEKVKKPEPEKRTSVPKMDLSFASAGEDGQNNNEKILQLHKAGKSNVAIAKELGLGIGEVKLVIDLFKGV